ncbi:MAG: cupin domain-containing protein [Gammaproteobacteria bacterium]|nr:MAG: cupin domain-containing protein [Gammaproteobacteria bacterium]
MAGHPLILRAAAIEAMAWERRVHFLNPEADRLRKSLGDAVGLSRIGVHLVRLEPGRDSTEHHLHHDEEECLYLLSGEGTLQLGEEAFEVGAGDFVGFPAGGPAHSLRNTGSEPLLYLVMGQRLEHDVADYPRRGQRLYRHRGAWDLVDLAALRDPRPGTPRKD